MVEKIELRTQNMIVTIMGSIVNIIGGAMCPLNEHKNLHFDNELDIHVKCKNYEESVDYAATAPTWICQASHSNRVFHVLVRQSTISGSSTLFKQLPKWSPTLESKKVFLSLNA